MKENLVRRCKCFCAITAAMFTVLAARAGDAWQTNYTAFGRLLVTQFVSAPFPHPARAAGHKYHDLFFSAAEHYSNSDVAIFIPKNFRATDKIDFVVHFHGWMKDVYKRQAKAAEKFSAGKGSARTEQTAPRRSRK